MNNRKSGIDGETLVCDYLRGKGYRVIERNFVCKAGEIDIIAEQGDTIAFVEVKAREGTAYGYPSEAITPAKIKKIVACAKYWAVSRGAYCRDMRFDAACVLRGEVEYIEDAFRP